MARVDGGGVRLGHHRDRGRAGAATFDIRASYLLPFAKVSIFRASVRGISPRQAWARLTAAVFGEPRGRLRTGIEGITLNGQKRLELEFRYAF